MNPNFESRITNFKRVISYPKNLQVNSLKSKLRGNKIVLFGAKEAPEGQTSTSGSISGSTSGLPMDNFRDEFDRRAQDFFGRGIMDDFNSGIGRTTNQPVVGIQERTRSPYQSMSPAPPRTNVRIFLKSENSSKNDRNNF